MKLKGEKRKPDQEIDVVPEWLRNGPAARFISVAAGTLNNLRSEKRGPRYVKRGKTVLYRKQDLIAWMEAQAVEPKN
jgi:hypothetical protein